MRPVYSEALKSSSWCDLVGEWEMSSPLFPEARGRAVFAWAESGAYLELKSEAPEPAPASLWMIGADDGSDQCTALYADSRGVSRVYGMRMAGDAWSIWRHGEPFSQRFEGRLDSDRRTLRGAWESSPDGQTWTRDFELVYTRL